MTAQEQRDYDKLRADKARIDTQLREAQQREAVAYRNSAAYLKETEKAAKRFASKMGIKTEMGKAILEGGRSEFDVTYNSRNHGVRVTGLRDELGTLPAER